MVRKRKNETVDSGTVDLSKDVGLTQFQEANYSEVTNRLPTMIPQLDYILGGGLPFGRMVEIMGVNSSGKSRTAVRFTRIAQMLGLITVWIDVEGTMEPSQLRDLGVDMTRNDIFMVEPDVDKKTGDLVPVTVEWVAEKLGGLVPALAKSGKPCVIIWDSVAQTPAEVEIERGVANRQPGLKGKALAQFSQIIAPLMTNSQVLFIAINQARDEMGSMFGGITSPGGNAFKHWASLRIEVKKRSQIKSKVTNAFGVEDEEYIGHIIGFVTVKSKVSRPNQKADAYLLSDNGLNFEENVYRSCLSTKQYNLISGGVWRKYTKLDGTEVKFNSDAAWVEYLRSEEGHPVLVELFGRMMAISFPSGYAPYNNRDVDITKIPIYKEIKDYQKTYGNAPEEIKVDPQEVDDLVNNI